ncbi:MAG TPA: tRNA adenosine deaminase-associated protein [Frankiaceae bacterium]|jgi:putative tRNA adenosine deaminase-associated protein|nr:tRNA adenosine deaminase-associated protein [Frankiaceae bacterium]
MADFAVVVSRIEGVWEAALLPERLVDDFEGLVAALRQQQGDTGVIGLVNVADEFFVAVRIVGADARVLLSDVTAAVAWDMAAQVCDYLGIERPGEDDLEDVWPAGDLSIFSDLGLDEMELGALLSDLDAYADETLVLLARRLGFAEAYERVVEPVFH